MRWENYVLLFLLFVPVTLSGQRFELNPDKDLVVSASTCVNLFVGAEVDLVRGDNCDQNILLSNEFSTVSFIDTAADSVRYTFTEPGTYVAFCGSVPGAIAVQSACFIVEAQPAAAIPTLSQWSIFILMISLLVFMVVAFLQKNRTSYLLEIK